MASRLTNLPGGVLIPSRCTLSTLAANTGATLTSDYSESTPRPGSAVVASTLNRLRVDVSGGQGQDLDLYTIRAGMPSANGASLAYRLGTDTASNDYRGWNPPVWLDGWLSLDYTTTDDYTRVDACTIPSTQVAVVVRRSNTDTEAKSRTIQPDDWAVSVVSTTGMDDGDAWNYPAILCLPGSERLLCLYGGVMYYSDDLGVTWAVYSTYPISEATTTYQRSRMAYYRGQILLLVEDSTSGTVHQYASSDLGVTFEFVETLAAWGSSVSIVVGPSALGVVFVDDTSVDDIYYVRMSSCYEPLSRADEDKVAVATQSIATYNALAPVAVAEPDGLLWVFYRVQNEENKVVTKFSTDDGENWTTCEGIVYDSGSTADFILPRAATAAAGRIVMPISWTASTATADNSLAVLMLGGWSTVTTLPKGGVSSWGYAKRSGSAGGPSGITGGTWLPIELPSNGGGWTSTGTAGTLGSGVMTITTAAATGYYTRSTAAGGSHVVVVQCTCESGGDIAAPDVGIDGVVADGVNEYWWRIHLDEAGFRVRDANAATTIATASIDCTTDIQIAVRCNGSGVLIVWYRRPGATEWTKLVDAVSLTSDTGSPAATGTIAWGNIGSGTATSTWSSVCYQYRDTTGEPRILDTATSILGRSLTSYPYPIADAFDSAGRACFLSITGGPAAQADTVSVDVEHDYPIDAVFPEVSPSPSVPWRATDETEQILCFDLGANTWLGSAVGLYIAGANFRTASLQYYDGATWQTLGTLDLATGFTTSLTYDLTGDTVRPRSGTAAGDRFLWERELVGGHAILDGADYREIVAQSAGGWTDATTARTEVRLTGIDGTEAANGTMVLVAPSGLLVCYPTSQQRRRYWRVRIPAQTTPHGYIQAGTILVGRVQPWGMRVDWARSDSWTRNVTTTRNSAGTSRVRELGPAARTWSVSWQDTVHHEWIRRSVDVDYVGVSGANPLAARHDVGMLLVGILEETRSGEIPVVVVEELPTATGVLTDPTRLLYSRIASDIAHNGVLGTLGTDEVYRVESVLFEEVV